MSTKRFGQSGTTMFHLISRSPLNFQGPKWTQCERRLVEEFWPVFIYSSDINWYPCIFFHHKAGFLIIIRALQVSQQFAFWDEIVEIDLKEFGRKHLANVSCMFVIPLETFRNSRRFYSGNTLTLARGYHPKWVFNRKQKAIKLVYGSHYLVVEGIYP